VPLGTWIAMAGSHAKREINEIVDRANDSINYINKLAHFGSNYSAGQVVIGAPPVGYSNDIYFFDDQNRNYQYPNNEPSHCGNFTGPWCLGLLRAGVSPYNLQYLPENTNNWCVASNLAGYVSWGAYGYGPNWCLYGRWGQVFFGTNSGWYIMATIESYNGRRDNYGQLSNYTDWFDRRAFSNLAQNTNYETTPVGAVCYAGEPASTGLSDGTVYFQNWNVGKYFCISAWSSAYCPCFFAVGDPLVVRKSNNP